ncbi:hypothetical protein FMN63_08235 [Stappia sp. BW2]|uniref:phasin family protein n=1 Tax=Stappia sp. BW2 TaxID=2592622 RepID=UPI0011DE7375|nr:phasin family protein [Stappia sp. BW2]TYC69902.1 hypothetical protein FMN63_08235 [Stappia sp. BW2]
MPTKSNTGAFDFSAMMAEWPKLPEWPVPTEWPMPTFSNWAFAEREDRIEAKTIESFQKMGQTMWSHAEKAFDDHMNFVSHRLHEDFECAKSLSQCAAPEETMAKLQEFYSRMASEYQTHFEKQATLFRNSFSEGAATVEELNETAMESVNEMSRAAEESLTEVKAAAAAAAKPKTSPRTSKAKS